VRRRLATERTLHPRSLSCADGDEEHDRYQLAQSLVERTFTRPARLHLR
jgi:hypothetical protein